MDLSRLPVIDNHCHPLSLAKAQMAPLELAQVFYHGIGDVPGDTFKGHTGPERQADIARFGVVYSLVAQLATFFACDPTLDAVTEARNARTANEGLGAYAEALYDDAGIVATVVDSDLTDDAPGLTLIPGRIMRLFQMGPAIDRVLSEADSYDDLLAGYQTALEEAVRVDGFIGVKSHFGEVVGFDAPIATSREAEDAFAAAKSGDGEAYKRLYTAVLAATLTACQDLDVPVHFHTGITGGVWNGPIGHTDPFLLRGLLSDPAYRTSKIVLLHTGYPWIEHASMMAHAFPQVWVDISWVTPWTGLRVVECMRAFMAVAPLSRLMVGSGGHDTPEVAWLMAKLAKIALSTVLDQSVELGLMAAPAAEDVARGILHDNAARLYGM